jgi:hypothetical protein
MRAPVKLVFLLMMLGGYAPAALAFSAEAHRAVGTLAESYLCPATRSYLAPLLAGSNLANAGVWADAVRDEPAWRHTRSWHYIDIADGESLEEAAVSDRDNVLSAIRRSEKDLADTRLSLEQRSVALRFFVHFVADVHQPLHVGRPEDRGGHEIEVRWGDERLSLHAFWDAHALLRAEGLSREDLAFAIGALASGQEQRWQAGSVYDWAEESRQLRRLAYDLPAARRGEIRLSSRYVAAARNVTSQRLAQAAVRLAGRLNELGCPGRPAIGGVPCH